MRNVNPEGVQHAQYHTHFVLPADTGPEPFHAASYIQIAAVEAKELPERYSRGIAKLAEHNNRLHDIFL
jgi:hypothetical protein